MEKYYNEKQCKHHQGLKNGWDIKIIVICLMKK